MFYEKLILKPCFCSYFLHLVNEQLLWTTIIDVVNIFPHAHIVHTYIYLSLQPIVG